MHHTLAYFKSVDNVANTALNAVSDGIITIQNNNFLPPNDMMILAAYVGSATLTRARLTSPTLRQVTQPQIRPVNVAVLPATNPNVQKFGVTGMRVKGLEELSVQVTSGVAMTENAYAVLCLLDRFSPSVAGDAITLRGTSTTAAVASTWSLLTYTLDDQLPNGTYAIVGSEVISTNAIAHRWTVDNQFFRPGGMSVTSAGNRTIDEQYDGSWGEWGRFKNTSLPRLEVLCNAADATHTIFLKVVKVA